MLPLKDCIRVFVIKALHLYQTKVLKMDIARSASVSVGTHLDKANPKGIHIGEETYLASGARVLAHDYCQRKYGDTFIGRQCFVGTDSLILCGVKIGDHVIVGAGSVVTRDVPSHSIVAGNPARIIRQGIMTTRYGQLVNVNNK